RDGDRFALAGEVNLRPRTLGDADGKPKAIAGSFPAHLDGPEDRLVTRLTPGDVADGIRADHDLPWRQLGEVNANAGEVLVEPDLRVAEHEVVLRDLGVGVPGFGEGGGATGELRAVAGRVGAGEQIKYDVGAVVVGQGAKDEVKADVAGGD